MPETVGEAFVAIRPDTSGFKQRVDKEVGGAVTGAVDTIKKQFLGLFAVAGATQLFAGTIREAQEAAKVGAQTEAVLKSTGEAANVTAAEIDALAESQSKKNAVDDETIQQGANLLLTFTNVRNEAGKGNDIFNQAVEVAGDLAAALGTDVTGASLQLGKALNDPIGGVTALQRAGVQLTDQQKEQIRVFVESGDILSAQKVILKELTTQVGGSAAAQATDLDRATVAWKNFQEAVGTALAPAVTAISTAGVQVLEFLSTLVEDLGGIVTIAPAVLFAIGAIGLVMSSATGPIGLLAAAVAGVILLLNDMGVIGGEAAAKVSDDFAQLANDLEKDAPDKALERFEKAAKKMLTELDNLGPAVGRTGAQLGLFKNVVEESPAAAQKLIDAMQKAGIETEDFERILGQGVRQKEADARASEEAAAANENYLKSITDIRDELLSLAGGQLGYEQSLINVEKAQIRLNEAIAQYGFESPEDADAALDLQDANINVATSAADLEAKQSELNDTFAGSPEKVQAQIDALTAARDANPALAASYDPIIAQLTSTRDLFAFLGSLPPANLTVTANVQQALDELGRLATAYNNATAPLRFLGFNVPEFGLEGFRAAGGPVGPGSWIVGERGPELLTLGAGGQGHVTDAATTASMMGGPQFSNTFNIVATEPEAAAHETVAVMRAVQVAVGF